MLLEAGIPVMISVIIQVGNKDVFNYNNESEDGKEKMPL